MFDGGSGGGGFGWGGFGGLGAPGQRVQIRQDRENEVVIPILQTLALAVLYPVCVFATLLNAYLLHIDGWFLLGFILPATALVSVLRGFTVSFKRRHFTLEGMYHVVGAKAVVVAVVIYIIWVIFWAIRGLPMLVDWWVANMPQLMWWTPSTLARLFVIPSSIGVYKASQVLGFRMGYEVRDPNWPPTIRPREPKDGPYNEQWFENLMRGVEIPDDTRLFVKTQSGRNGTGSWKYYEPPEGVSYMAVWRLMCAINENQDEDGTYKWIGEANLPRGIGQKKYYKIQGDWIERGYSNKLSNNGVVMTETGIVMMQNIIDNPPGK